MKWICPQSNEDFPKHQCLMTFIYKDDVKEGIDHANLYAETGVFSRGVDSDYMSIISDGEVVMVEEVFAYIELPYTEHRKPIDKISKRRKAD